jgi:hypothetical protein
MNAPGLSTGAMIGIAAGVVLVLLFLGVVAMIVRRESMRGKERAAERVRAKAPRRAVSSPSAWEGADSARGARDQPRPRVVETPLPPITMNTTDWGVGTADPTVSQASLIASQPVSPDAGGVYRTGFNPFYKSTSHIQVEEVADLVQQAELMVTLDNVPVAINMLTRHIRETEKPVPKAWLLLFELYLKTNRREQYENLAKGFRALFNARVPSWDDQKADDARGLESYTAVMGKLQRLWGLPSCRDFLESLLYDDRGGARQGFTLSAYAEILFLIETIETALVLDEEEEERRKIELKLQPDRPPL